MHYLLYTTVDITHTGQHRLERGKESEFYKEQNFQTVLQTLGLRANVSFTKPPQSLIANGSIFGFNVKEPICIWQFNFSVEQDHLYLLNDSEVGYMIKDFTGVPFISGLNEFVEQNYDVFVAEEGPARNIIFQLKQ